MSVYSRLMIVQKELHVPKAQMNSFGKYKYRSCEDILAVAKPLCIASGLLLSLSDEVNHVGDSNYIESCAEVIDVETNERHSVTASARESVNKKGMDDSQITGTASSYARKYALNGLFGIDDTKDADTDEYAKNTKPSSKPTTVEMDKLTGIALDKHITYQMLNEYAVKKYNAQFNKIDTVQYVEMLKYVSSKKVE